MDRGGFDEELAGKKIAKRLYRRGLFILEILGFLFRFREGFSWDWLYWGECKHDLKEPDRDMFGFKRALFSCSASRERIVCE